MIAVKSIAAIYVGLYLILPNCLCQVLVAFGIEGHGHAHVSSTVIDLESEISADLPIAVSVCHCDDVCSKTANVASFDSENFDLKWAQSDIELFALIPSEVDDFSSINARGPPDSISRWSLAPFSGVYLL